MKTSTSIQNEPGAPALFHIVSSNVDFALPPTSQSVSTVNKTPFEDLMLHPDKLEAAFKTAKRENDAFDASRKFSQGATKSIARNATCESNDSRPPLNYSRPELKLTEFYLAAPFAKSVKLAADFTDWEKYPLDLIKSEDGVWFTDVPLPQGQYAYRFIVDGQWLDDPHPAKLAPNQFGTMNAVMKVL